MASIDISSVMSVLSGCFYQPVAGRIGLLCSLRSKARALSAEVELLEALKADVSARLDGLLAADPYKVRSSQATQWFDSVERLVGSSGILAVQVGKRLSNWNRSRFRWRGNYNLATRAKQLLEEAGRLKERGANFTTDQDLVIPAPLDVAQQLRIDADVVGQDEELAAVLRKIGEERVNKVGICGMGGIGKTTLLQRINNHFYGNAAGDFDVILYVTAGKEKVVDIARMQKEIGKRLGLSLSGDSDEREQASRILRSLQSKNFLLLLDDLWEEIDLGRLGIPSGNMAPERKRKVVITARDEKVCADMGVRERGIVRMEVLSPGDSWQLFCRNVGNEDVLRHERIEPLAQAITKKCGGLPLALVAVGTAMASATEVYEWESARSDLEKSAHEVRGMEQKVLSPLKFSFDRLQNDVLREILFLCLFKLGTHSYFNSSGLAVMIVGEGLVPMNESASIHNWESALVKAQSLISSLLKSGLLMRRKKSRLELHDCVHDMLLWAMEKDPHHKKMVKWNSLSGDSTQRLQHLFGGWEAAKRISMDFFDLPEIPNHIEIPSCGRDLLTFSCCVSKIVRLPERFFQSMSSLRVLTLEDSCIEELPRSIGSLVNLKLLDLCTTSIARLPEEMGNLQQLTVLNLTNTSKLKHIPRECISRLYKLEELLMISCDEFKWSWDNSCSSGSESQPQVALKDLKDLTKRGALRCITITLENDSEIMLGLSHSPRLVASISDLQLRLVIERPPEEILLLLSTMQKLERICFEDGLETFQESLRAELRRTPSSLFSHLRDVFFFNCYRVFNLTWLRYVPSLELVSVERCQELTTLLSSEEEGRDLGSENQTVFLNLKKLQIINCPQLGCIAGYPFLFPSLLTISISDCPRLNNMPLTEQNAPKLTKIKGSQEWWDGLEWESETIKSRFLPCFYS